MDKLAELAFYTLPAIITGGVAYYLFQSYFKDQQNMRRWLIQKENKNQVLPLRLQAYERLALYLERINPSNLLLRVTPISENSTDYENYIIAQIDQEFEHNVTQQIYVSNECWKAVTAAKNATIQIIRATNKLENIVHADQLRETILTNLIEKQSPSSLALDFVKNEISQIW